MPRKGRCRQEGAEAVAAFPAPRLRESHFSCAELLYHRGMLRPLFTSFLACYLCLTVPRPTVAAPAAAAPSGGEAGKKAPAPPLVSPLKVEVTLDRPDWTYAVGESATFIVRVTRDGSVVPGAKVHYTIGFEKMPTLRAGDVEMAPEGLALETDVIKEAGFVACEVEVAHEGRTYRGRAAAGFSPGTIAPTVPNPPDFDGFWGAARKQLANIPLDVQLVPMPERSTRDVDCYHASVANVPQGKPSSDGKEGPPSRIYGVLCEPSSAGNYPALLMVPGAGIRSYRGAPDVAAKGVITFQMGIHGIPVNLDNQIYDALSRGALANYPTIHSEDKDLYYYRRVYLGAVRGNDLLASRPRWNKKQLGVTGGSQGGALAITTAALDPRVKALVAFYPALADHTGFLHGRTGGWPFMLRPEWARTPARLATLPFYDVVNFARRLKAPGFYSWGFNDETCPPTSLYAAYNVITAPKTLTLALANGHFTTPEQSEQADAWLLSRLGVKAKQPGDKP